MTHLSIHEWSRVPVHNESGPAPAGHFTRSQANALIAAARSHALGGDEGTGIISDHYRHLTAKQMVGIVAAPGCSLEILPKIETLGNEDQTAIRRRLVRMLDVALSLDIGEGAAASMARQNETLLDILIRLFADQLLAEARRGLPRSYLPCEADLPMLRGRLDTMRQFTLHAVRPDRLASRFDALSPDIALMQIMKACVVALRRFARGQETKRRLDELRFLLADVSDLKPRDLPWKQVRIDRTNRRWEALYRLARLFLKKDWQATHHASNSTDGITLLFPMNDLFEGYVAALAARALRGTGLTVQSQGGRLYCLLEDGETGRARFQTKPDLLVKHGDRTVLVADTKWKRLSPRLDDAQQGISQSDVYQMMAYGRLYRCTDLVLIYPHHLELGPGETLAGYTVNHCEDRLRVASVNIASGEEQMIASLRNLILSHFACTEENRHFRESPA